MIAEVPNPEKDKSIYVTFFGTTNSLNPLRPSGIFDEPGSLVYWNILWMIIGIKKYNLTRNKVLMNFFLLLCTGSLALLIFIIIYLFKSFGKKVIQSGLALLGIFLLIPNNLSTRINFDYITENNRMKQFYNISENLNVDVLIYGWEYVYGSTEEVGDVSSIILSITFIYGALLSIIVLYLLGYLISKINTENWHLALIFLALVIQRPYFFSLYWSIPLFISYLFIIESNENTSNRIVLRE